MKIILSRNLVDSLTASVSRIAVASLLVKQQLSKEEVKTDQSLISKLGFSAIKNVADKAFTVTKEQDSVSIEVNDNFLLDAVDVIVKAETRLLGLVVPIVNIGEGFAEDMGALSKKWETPSTYVAPNGKIVTAYRLHEFYTLDVKTVAAIVEDLANKEAYKSLDEVAAKYGLARVIIKQIHEEYFDSQSTEK